MFITIERPAMAETGDAAHRSTTSVARQIVSKRLVNTLCWLLIIGVTVGLNQAQATLSPLRVQGRHFVDDTGRVVILRGVNLSGRSKVPPFDQGATEADFDRMVSLGMNVIRLVFIWEAYEPFPGQYDESYLNRLRELATQAASRGIYTIIDIHQDGFSRFTSRGAGDGFPSWAVSRVGTVSPPDKLPNCSNWAILVAIDRTTHKSFMNFFSDTKGVRTSFLNMTGRLAEFFAATPGVVGYDLLNEPWGKEKTELAPLYEDMAKIIRARHPQAILFVEGHLSTNCGYATALPRPSYEGFVCAPHYYKTSAIMMNAYRGTCLPIDHAFKQMAGQSRTWNCPLFIGEFGISATAKNATAYMHTIYDRLDAVFASGTQWNLTPDWDPIQKDGWNGEDFSIFDNAGNPRANYVARPFPRATAGMPIHFEYQDESSPRAGRVLHFKWNHQPGRGDTEISLPDGLFRGQTEVEVTPGAKVSLDRHRRVLIVRSSRAGEHSLRIWETGIETKPIAHTRLAKLIK
jgi:endoglycosylceramidase